MKRGFRCKAEILSELQVKYDEMGEKHVKDFLTLVQDFENISERNLRKLLDKYYKNSRSRDQAWRTCKGSLYEYAVFKAIEQIISSDASLKNNFIVLAGDEALIRYKDKFVIKNWCDIYPDADILIVEKDSGNVRVIVSCKTSLRERLTETAFWKRELERNPLTKEVKLVFVTTDKDNELRGDTNRYILLHVIDCTFVTDPVQYDKLMETYKKRYGNRHDFETLTSKIRKISEIGDYLKEILL